MARPWLCSGLTVPAEWADAESRTPVDAAVVDRGRRDSLMLGSDIEQDEVHAYW